MATWISPPPTVALFLLGAGYEDNPVLPANSAGRAVLQELANARAPLPDGRGSANHRLRLVGDRIHDLRVEAPWDAGLDAFHESTLLMVVSAHGGADIHGAYLLPTNADARPLPLHRLRLETVLDRLERLPSSVKKVLILDVTQLPAHWPLGMLHNDFARGIEALEPRIRKIPNLVVILSSGPDQLSWTSHDWGKTIFGHYLLEGLLGGADLDGQQRIDAWELHRFTRDKVNHWTLSNRSAEQTPMLYPRGAEGEARAKAIVLTVGERDYVPADPEAISPAPLPASLQAAWRQWQTLRSATPAPHVHAPHLWQQYQTTLLQYESALRFGDAVTAQQKLERLNRLEAAIAEAGRVRLRSVDATLAMAMVEGKSPAKSDPATEAFLKAFWEAPNDEEAKDVLSDARKKLWKDRAVPVGELAAWIVQRTAQEKLPSLPRAAQRLRLILQGDTPLPAEAHWVVMMQRDLPTETRKQADVIELFSLAMETRVLAEQTAVSATSGGHAYSEEIESWIAGALAHADERRQFGQDLLLSTRAKDWQAARTFLLQAKDAYEGIRKQAEIVQHALATRDQALAALPAYSHWLASRPASVPANPPVNDPNLDKAVKELWQDLHALMQGLDKPDHVDMKLVAARLPRLKEQTQKVASGFNALERRFDQFLDSLLRAPIITTAETRHVWLETEAALLVPQPDLQRRAQLLVRQQRLSNRLLIESHMKPTPSLQADPNLAARRQAHRQGEMALALLGKTWFDRFAGLKEEHYALAQHRLDGALVEEKWHDTVLSAGHRIGQRFRRMPLETQRLLAANPKADLAQHRQAMQAADGIARRMEATLPMPDGLDPVGAYRRLQLGNFLLSQAQRTLQEHWYDDNPNAEPNYRVAGRSFLGDARALAPADKRDRWTSSFQQAVSAMDKKLQAPGELTVVETTEHATDADGRLIPDRTRIASLTSEQEWRREYRLVPASREDRLPLGYPVLWMEDSAGVRAVEPKASERFGVALTPEQGELEKAAVVPYHLTSPLIDQAETKGAATPFKERSPLSLHGLYRGQIILHATPVDVQPVPTTIVKQFPLPEKASVAVRTGQELTTRLGTNDSGIVFVLDCSGSMGVAAGTDIKQGRYYQALQALRSVLKRVPKGTSVSVLTFGQAVGAEMRVLKAEQTIDHALKPMPWNPQDPKQLDDLMAALSKLEPWNESPIARTLLFARDDLANIKGSKTIVAITDGYDNRFEHDMELSTRFKSIPALLKAAFDNGDISLHVVLFPPADVDEKKALDQFRTIESFKPAGKIHPIHDVSKLAETLTIVLRQRLNYWIDRTGRNVTVNDIPQSGLDVSTSDKNDRWLGKGLPPGGHKVRVNVPERVEKNVLLHRGDLLLLDLVETPEGMQFERFLFSDDYAWKRRLANQAKDWRLSVLQNQQMDRGGLQMLLGLEKTVDRRETILEQIKPRDAWIELSLPPEARGAISTRWSYLHGYPAPAWSLDVPAWPSYPGTTTPARPVVDVWWNPDEEAHAATDLPVSLLLQERNRPVVVKNENNVIVESVTLEKHHVEVERGVFAWRQCLVVRMRYDKDRPIITRLTGVESAGAEHRLYATANKYTGLFWFGAKDQEVPTAARLRFISVHAFKEEAVRRGYWLQVRDLPPPEPTDFRPRPPLELK